MHVTTNNRQLEVTLQNLITEWKGCTDPKALLCIHEGLYRDPNAPCKQNQCIRCNTEFPGDQWVLRPSNSGAQLRHACQIAIMSTPLLITVSMWCLVCFGLHTTWGCCVLVWVHMAKAMCTMFLGGHLSTMWMQVHTTGVLLCRMLLQGCKWEWRHWRKYAAAMQSIGGHTGKDQALISW